MHESWPACGGSTSVGIRPLVPDVEKSRRRATGVSNTISCGVVQAGALRAAVSSNQRGRSSAPGPCATAAVMQSTAALIATAQPFVQLSNRGEAVVGGPGLVV